MNQPVPAPPAPVNTAATPSSPDATADERPFVSVIIPVYNGEAELDELLRCLQAQTYPGDRVEYLIVDNASRDRTFAHLQDAVAPFAAAGLTLHPLQAIEIQSSYAARNVGILAAQGSILAFTDADCRPEPQWLSEVVAGFQGAGVATPVGDDRPRPRVGMVAGEICALLGSSLLERYAEREETLSQKHTLAHPFYPYGQTANLAVRREVLTEIGLFRPYLTTGGDADLCWRMHQETDWAIAAAPQAIVRHRHRVTWAELGSQWRRYGRSNRYLHDLHGIPLMEQRRSLSMVRNVVRWVLKEVPLHGVKLALGRSTWVDLWQTPIGMYCFRARWQGQQQAQLPKRAREIMRLPTVPTPPDSV